MQILFLLLLYFPLLLGFIGSVAFAEIGEFLVTTDLWEFIVVGCLTYLLALALPFANLLWVRLIKLCVGGHVHENGVKPGVYPRWSRMHLRTWCIGRLERSVLRPLSTMFRSAPLMAWVLRGLGATVGKNVHCAHAVEFFGPLDLLSIENNVAIQTGAYLSMSRWVGQELHIGPVHLESGCKIGMRAGIANDVTVGRGSWITPLTPILADVGAEEMWEGAPARFAGRCTEVKNKVAKCKQKSPFWFMETLNILMQVFLDFWLLVAPTASVAWFAATLTTRRRDRRCQCVLPDHTAARDRLAHEPLRVRHHLGDHRPNFGRGLRLPSLHTRLAGAVSLTRAQGRSPLVPSEDDGSNPAPVDLEHHWTVSAYSRWSALCAHRCL